MLESPTPCGAWRLLVRTLGPEPDLGGEVMALARLDDDGAVTVHVGAALTPGVGSWRPAGPGRVVVVAEWFVRTEGGRSRGRVSVRVAAELSPDGRTCSGRVQWCRFDLSGRPDGPAVAGEVEAARLEA